MATEPQNLIRLCPRCGSGGVQWCQISVRAYCHECKTWAPVNYGTEADGVRVWNRMVEKAHGAVNAAL